MHAPSPLLMRRRRACAAAAEHSLAWQGAVDVSVGCEHCAGHPDAGTALLTYTLPGAALAVQPPLSKSLIKVDLVGWKMEKPIPPGARGRLRSARVPRPGAVSSRRAVPCPAGVRAPLPMALPRWALTLLHRIVLEASAGEHVATLKGARYSVSGIVLGRWLCACGSGRAGYDCSIRLVSSSYQSAARSPPDSAGVRRRSSPLRRCNCRLASCRRTCRSGNSPRKV